MSKLTKNIKKIIKRFEVQEKKKKECPFKGYCKCCATNPFTILRTLFYGEEK